MTSLYERIKALYPELTDRDFLTVIRLQNNSDGLGDFIALWKHPQFERPTQEQLDAIV